METDQITIHSDEVQEILGTPPGWILRWGTTVIVAGCLTLGGLSWWFKYPDIIKASATLTTQSVPVNVVARSSGYLSRLLVRDKDQVTKGQVLAILQNPARYEDVMLVDGQIDKMSAEDAATWLLKKPDRDLELGELQNDYSNFIQAFEAYVFTQKQQYDKATIQQYQQQIRTIREGIDELKRIKSVTEQELVLIQRKFKDKQWLYTSGAITLNELEEAKAQEYQKEKELKNLQFSAIEKQKEIDNLNAKILQTAQVASEGNMNKYNHLKETINQLRSNIEIWKQTYLLTAPMDGAISLFSYRNEQLFIKSGEEVLAIVATATPAGSDSLTVRVLLPSGGSGKVKTGQRVMIKLEGYPYEEYGYLEGTVVSKSMVPKDNQYFIQVSLRNGLQTNKGKTLVYSQQMSGTAEIITDDRRLIERFFDQVTAVFRH